MAWSAPAARTTGTRTASKDDNDEKEAKKSRNGVAVICGCEQPRRVRVPWSVWEAGPITCGVCGQEFHDPDTAEDDEEEDD